MNQIVKYEVNGQEIQLSPDIIRKYLGGRMKILVACEESQVVTIFEV